MNETIIILAVNGEVHVPIGIASGIDECIELIHSDRMKRSGHADHFCPEHYALWRRDIDGSFTNVNDINF